MYNQYVNGNDFVLLEPEPQSGPQRPQQSPSRSQPQSRPAPPPDRNPSDLFGEVTGGVAQLLNGVMKHFSLEQFDTGDILLVLIILFLFLEGDNLEIVITLGLMLLLGLGED